MGVKGQPDQGGTVEITDRGLLYPVLGLTAASIVTALHQLIAGEYPGLVTIANIYVFGLGFGLILARFGRLGPFGGILGLPWQETRIEEILDRESARAIRYGRNLTVVALRPMDKARLEIHRGIRETDQHLVCRNGWNVLILPETDRDSTVFLLRQICGTRPVMAALASPDPDRPRHRIGPALLAQMRSTTLPEVIAFPEREAPDVLPLAS